MDDDAFRDRVLELSRRGTRITKGNVALELGVSPSTANTLLDRLVRDGGLELDIDERSGEIFYEVRGRKPAAGASAPGSGLATQARASVASLTNARDAIAAKLGAGAALANVVDEAGSLGTSLPDARRRKITIGVLVGGLLPGFGLAYSAPWPVAIGAALVFALGFKLIALIPFLSAFLLIPFVTVCAIASAVLGGLYTWQYNQTGKRTPLGDVSQKAGALVSATRVLKRLSK